MKKNHIVEQAERRVFRASYEDGLIDIGIAAFTLMFTIAPLLSEYLGDFWSSFVFLPFFGLLYLLLRWVRKRFVLPRTGQVAFGPQRVARLKRGGLVMLVLNVIFLIIGAITFFYPGSPGFLIAIRFSAALLVFFSMAGYFYDYPMLYLYGILTALAIPVGEWLWQQGLASHHGYPVVFGAATGFITLVGLVKFTRLMLQEVPIIEEQPNEGRA